MALVVAVPAAGGPVVAAGPTAGPVVFPAAVPAVAVDDPADPGRLAYIGDGDHRSLVTVGPRGGLTPALPVGVAGNDCQGSARGDDLVFVSDRDGDAEGVYHRVGQGDVTTVFRRADWRVARPVLSPDRQWVAFVAWDAGDGDGEYASTGRCQGVARLSSTDRPAVYVSRVDGTGLRLAVEDADWVDWSPDGTQFVFTRQREAFRAPVAGGDATRVSPAEETAEKPVWEPDVPGGKGRIAYVSTRMIPYGGGGESGGERRHMVLAAVVADAGGEGDAEVLAIGSTYSEATRGAAWRPDGRQIAFLSQEPYLVDPTVPACGTCWGTPVFDPDSVVDYATESVGWYTGPGTAPALPALLLGGQDPEYTNIEESRAGVPTDRLQLRTLQDQERDLSDPAYSPDGRSLAFVASEGDGEGEADGDHILVGEPKKLAQAVRLRYDRMLENEQQGRPAWSPDGTKLAFERWTDNSSDPLARIAVVDISDGVENGKLLYVVPERQPESGWRCSSDERDPTWSPDGTKLAFSRWSECWPIIGLRAAPSVPSASSVPSTPPAPSATATTGGTRDGSATTGGTRDGSGTNDGTRDGTNDRPRDGSGTTDGSRTAAADDYRDRHIWTSEAKPTDPVQYDVTGQQCGEGCRVLDLRPAWHPGGGTIAFVRQATAPSRDAATRDAATRDAATRDALSSGYEGPSAVMEMSADGTTCAGLVPKADDCPLTPPAPGQDETGREYDEPVNPAWSPDGLRLAVDVVVSGWDSVTDRRLMIVNPSEDKGRILPGKIHNAQSQPTWKPSSDLRTYLTTPDSPLLLGRTGTLTLVVWNLGIAHAPRVRAQFTLPPGLEAVGPPEPSTGTGLAPGTCAADLTCVFDPVQSGQKGRATLRVKGVATGEQKATVTAASALPDHLPADNSAEVVVNVVVPDLAVTATATPPVINIRERSTVEFTVTNGGTAAARDVLLKLVVPPGLTLVSGTECPPAGCSLGVVEPGAERKLTLVYTAENAFSGAIEGTLSASTPDSDPENDRASVDLTVVDPRLPDPAVTVTATPAVIRTGFLSDVVYTVRNLGDAPARAVTLTTLLPPGMRVVSATPPCPDTGCALGDLAPGASVTVTRKVTADAPLVGEAVGTVTTPGADSNPGNNTAAAPITVLKRDSTPPDNPTPPRLRADPSVTVDATPRTAYTGGRISARVVVRNEGVAKATGLRLVVAVPRGVDVVSASKPQCLTPAGCPLPDLRSVDLADVRLVLGANRGLTGAITATVTTTGTDSRPANNTGRAPLTVKEPTLTLIPPLGPPGSVTQASGTQFPPGATLRLRWSRGVTVAAAPVVVRADGTFSAPMLILVQDTLGERELRVAQAGVRAPLFRELTAPYLVVPGVLQPSDFQWRR